MVLIPTLLSVVERYCDCEELCRVVGMLALALASLASLASSASQGSAGDLYFESAGRLPPFTSFGTDLEAPGALEQVASEIAYRG